MDFLLHFDERIETVRNLVGVGHQIVVVITIDVVSRTVPVRVDDFIGVVGEGIPVVPDSVSVGVRCLHGVSWERVRVVAYSVSIRV